MPFFPHSSPFLHSPSLSQAARGTNWRPAEPNVPGAGSQMVLAEGWRERGMDATKIWSAEDVVWHGSVGELALHTKNLLVLRGLKAVHELVPGSGLTWSELFWLVS